MTNVSVIGATGKVGRRIVARLRGEGHEVRPASRSGEPRFDWFEPATWAGAVRGADALYVTVPDTPAPVAELIEATGVRQVVLLGARGSEHAPAGTAVRMAEDVVRASDAEWTILRPTWFLQNLDEGTFAGPLATGELRLPAGTGRHPFIDAEDIAAVAVAALTERGHAGVTYDLSGPVALTFEEVVAAFGAATGRDLRYVPVARATWVGELVATGLPTELAELLGTLLDLVATGADAHLSDGVQRALHREPATLTDYLDRITQRTAAPAR
ncbi:NAD(P)H-binding protein [Pseudonocardia sp. TRM90224]|uniref:NAD(P)H-binding protein n=1 Tax=Pseudonocardia sp. TRM90224 TaxID=2812678 RepID=UPI001E585430|nr:NAD(P)H-binding protein [Pseudonocardia sp. TRM90224]